MLSNKLLINNTDVFTTYGVFLAEEKRGGRENLTAIMTPAKAKAHVGVNFREQNGTKYAATLLNRSEQREVTLHFAQIADSQQEWLTKYTAFIQFLKTGNDGWLDFHFTELNLTLRMFYLEATAYTPLTTLWQDGRQAARYKIKFQEPNPTF